MDYGSITTAVQGARFIGDTLRALSALKIDSEVLSRVHDALSALSEVQSKLLESQQGHFEQQRQIEALTRELERASHWASRAEGYELAEAPGGAVVFRSLHGLQHYACPVCFEKQTISILQDRDVYAGIWDCKACNATYRVSSPRQAAPNRIF